MTTDTSFATPQETASLDQLRKEINQLFRQIDISRCEKKGLLEAAKMAGTETSEYTRRILGWKRTYIVSVYSKREIIPLDKCVTEADEQLALLVRRGVRDGVEEATLCSFVKICGTTTDGTGDPFAIVVPIGEHVDMFDQIRDALRLLV